MRQVLKCFLVFLTVSAAIAPCARGTDLSASDVKLLIAMVRGSNGVDRVSATRELFRRGPKVAADLVAAGARRMFGVVPSREDVIYTLLSGLPSTEWKTESLGLHFDSSITKEAVDRMGLRYGFRLEEGSSFSPNSAPTCYIHLLRGRSVAAVMRELLVGEPDLKTINS